MKYTFSNFGIKHKLTSLVLAAALVAAPALFLTIKSTSAAESYNEGFEDSTNDYTTHGDNASFFVIDDSSQARSGSRALKIISNNSDPKKNKISELTRWIGKIDAQTVTPGEQYRFEVYLRTQGVKDTARLSVSFFESSKGSSWLKTSTAANRLTGTQDWTKVVMIVDVPEGAKYMRPEFRLFDRGTLWIDDLSVTNLTNAGSEGPEPTVEPEPSAEPEPIEEVEEPAEQVVVVEPIDIEIEQQPPQPLDEADFSINFEPSQALAANAVPADLTMRLSFPTNCTLSHRLPDDPIVFPGQSGASHSHDFFGDTNLDANSTVQSVLDHGGNSCLTPDDRSAYWVPTVYDNGKEQRSTKTKFYYKAGFLNPSTLQTMPTGLRIIAGNANATSNQSPQVGFWWAAPKLKTPENVPSLENSTRAKNKMISTNTRDKGISLRINFPQCWDGENLYLPNSEHMAYPGKRNRSTGYSSCPSSHPVPVPMLLMIIDYPESDGGADFALSSGDWYTFHADFINAWHPASLEGLIDRCLRDGKRCRNVRPSTCAARGLSSNKCVTVRPENYIL